MKTESDYLEDLIRFASVSSDDDKQPLEECARHCSAAFKRRGLYTELLESGGFPIVYASSQPTKKPKLLLQCHMDVVPADKSFFKMTKQKGRLMGRGVFDMKFACASYLKVLDRLEDNLKEYDFGIMLSFDEEIGGSNGVKAFLDKGYGAEVCILPDSGKNWCLESSANGAWFIKILVEGKNAHGSMPHLGINAAEKLSKIIEDINKLRNEYPEEELTVSLTGLKAGKATNQIPDHAEATFDIRYRDENVLAKIKTALEKVCAQPNIEIKTLVMGACMDVDTKHPKVVSFIKTAEDVLDKKISYSHSTGSTDARFFCAKDIPTIVIQPDGGGRHSNDEWVDEKGLGQLTEILYRYIREEAAA